MNTDLPTRRQREASEEIRIPGHGLVQHLDCDISIELVLGTEVNLFLPTRADQVDDPTMARRAADEVPHYPQIPARKLNRRNVITQT